ncbi:MAG: sigma-70 family RNA polymerase sigma factor [Candidatus Sungiibacteriota bacterium]
MRFANPLYLTPMQQEGYLALFGFKGQRPASIAETCRLAWPEKFSPVSHTGLKAYIFQLRSKYFHNKFLPVFLKQQPVPKGNEAFWREIWTSAKTLEELKAGFVFPNGRPKRSVRPTVAKREPNAVFRKIRTASTGRDLFPKTAEDAIAEHDPDGIREVDFDAKPGGAYDDERKETRLHSYENVDILKKYLHEIGQVPLLTREEEVNLAGIFAPYYLRKRHLESLREARDELNQKKQLTRPDRKKKGEIKKDINRHAVFVWQTEHSGRINEISEARKSFIEANLRLVVSVAKKYRAISNASFDLTDLIQVGNLGLFRAVEKFDPKMGFKFSTFATWWIRQTISRYLADCGSTVRQPVHIVEKVRRHKRISSELEQKAGRALDHDELQKKLNVSDESYDRIRVSANLGTTPLDAPINSDESETTLMDLFFKDELPRPDESYDNDSLVAEMQKQLARLPERQREVLCYRFGISMPECGIKADREHTLDEIGKIQRVTRERIRQIQVKAMRRLAKKARSSPLKLFA